MSDPGRALALQRLSTCNTVAESCRVWVQSSQELQGCQYIWSCPIEPHPFLPIPRRFKCGAELVSPFAHRGFVFLDGSNVQTLLQGKSSQDRLGYSVALDINTIRYLSNILREPEGAAAGPYGDLISFAVDPAVNWDPQIYFFENSADFDSPGKTEHLRETFATLLRLKHLDPVTYRRSGRLVTTISDRKLNSEAGEVLDSYLRAVQDERWQYEVVAPYRGTYAVLLKAAQIQCDHHNKPSSKRCGMMLQFMHREMSHLLLPQLLYACEFLSRGTALRFFSKIQRGGTEMVKHLKNMAWDLQTIRRLSSFPPDVERDGRFFVHYLLTSDQGLVELMQAFPLRAVAIMPDSPLGMPFPQDDTLSLLRDRFGISDQILSECVTAEAASERRARFKAGGVEFASIIADLEQRVAAHERR